MPRLNSASMQQLKDWNNGVKKRVSIRLCICGHKEDKAFEATAQQLSQNASNLEIKNETCEDPLPGFFLTDNIRFHAFPLEKELAPFLDALMLTAQPDKMQNRVPMEAVSKINLPVHLKLYIALMCPHCPQMVKNLVPAAMVNSNIRLDIIDGSLFSDVAQKDQVMAAPCLILDNDFRWTGNTAISEIIEMILNREPSGLSSRTLKNILEQGDASWITRQMIRSDQIYPAFVKLILHETWSVRLGAMVVVEELAEQSPKLAQTICPMLISAFDEVDIPIKGDIFYALGEAGNLKTRQWIETQLNNIEHPDLMESAKDAMISIEERHG